MNEDKLKICGDYELRSPYHKTKKMLPFSIEMKLSNNDYLCITVEYQGREALRVKGYWKKPDLIEMINSGLLKKVAF